MPQKSSRRAKNVGGCSLENYDNFQVSEMMLELDSDSVRVILEMGIDQDADAAVFPAIADLINRGDEDDVRDVILSFLANDQICFGSKKMKKIISFILERADKNGSLYDICTSMDQSDSLADFLEERKINRVFSFSTGEFMFVSYY